MKKSIKKNDILKKNKSSYFLKNYCSLKIDRNNYFTFLLFYLVNYVIYISFKISFTLLCSYSIKIK